MRHGLQICAPQDGPERLVHGGPLDGQAVSVAGDTFYVDELLAPPMHLPSPGEPIEAGVAFTVRRWHYALFAWYARPTQRHPDGIRCQWFDLVDPANELREARAEAYRLRAWIARECGGSADLDRASGYIRGLRQRLRYSAGPMMPGEVFIP